jgi:hypothetical protein
LRARRSGSGGPGDTLLNVTAAQLRIVFLLDAVLSAAVGLLLLSGTWDGLFDALDLPQARPALFVQVGGAAVLGAAYLLWLAARMPALMLPLARAAAIINGLGAAVVIAWLINGGLGIDTLGTIELVAAAVVMGVFTVIYLVAGFRPGGYGPEPPLPPTA